MKITDGLNQKKNCHSQPSVQNSPPSRKRYDDTMQISARILAIETSAAATPLLDHLSLVLAVREMVTNQMMILTVLGISTRARTTKRSP